VKIRMTSAGGLVFDGGDVLVLRRTSGEWVMPKGKVEQGELPSAAAVREVTEETGLSVAVVSPVGTTSFHYTTKDGYRIDKLVHWFIMCCLDAQPRVSLRLEPTFAVARFLPPPDALSVLTYESDQALLRQALTRPAATPSPS
jgi:8-oxo-dGTP pyrophosphatase MutT (NUDIX family)